MPDLCSAGVLPAVPRASCPERGGREAHPTTAGTAALRNPLRNGRSFKLAGYPKLLWPQTIARKPGPQAEVKGTFDDVPAARPQCPFMASTANTVGST